MFREPEDKHERIKAVLQSAVSRACRQNVPTKLHLLEEVNYVLRKFVLAFTTVAAELSDTAGKDVFEVTVLSVKNELDVITLSRWGANGWT
jgi:hypothetical protein